MFDIQKIIKQAEDNGLKNVHVRTTEADGKVLSIEVTWNSIALTATENE